MNSLRTMRRQRFEVLDLAQRLERQALQHRRENSRLRQWVRAFGKPQSLALCFGVGLLTGFYSKPRSPASAGRLLRWSNTLLLLTRLGQRARAAGAGLADRPVVVSAPASAALNQTPAVSNTDFIQ